MKDLPAAFAWLNQEPGPRMLRAALELYGTHEDPAKNADNPDILKWAREIGGNVEKTYRSDDQAWCGLFMALIAKRAEKPIPATPLWALSWADFGTPVPAPMLGDVLVYKRFDKKGKLIGGHVTLYVGEDDTHYYGLGGNQSDQVSIAARLKSTLFRSVRPHYKVQPANVRPVLVKASGVPGGSEV